MQRLLTFDDLVAAGYVANRVTLNRRIKNGQFPGPIRVGSRNVAWLKHEIEAWEAKRIAQRDACYTPADWRVRTGCSASHSRVLEGERGTS